MSDLQPSPFDAALQQAVSHHQAGQLSEAEQIYRAILKAQPNHSDANYNLGILAAQRGDAALGLLHLRIAVQIDPTHSHHWLSYAAALLKAGHVQDAFATLEQGKQRGFSGPAFDQLTSQIQRALKTSVSEAENFYKAALQHHRTGRIKEAILLYGQAIMADPGLAEAHNNLGTALAAQGKHDEAAASYRRALDIAPRYVEAHINLGNTLHALGEFVAAVVAYRHALEIAPDDIGTLYNLGNLLMRENKLEGATQLYDRPINNEPNYAEMRQGFGPTFYKWGRVEESCACFSRHARLAYGKDESVPHSEPPPLPHKTRHDREQQDYLVGICGEAAGRKFHLADGSRLSSPAVNLTSGENIEEQWKRSHPQIVVIDDLLTGEALERLQRFCWDSTIWRRTFADGYLGAMPEHGLACPLLAQISGELRAAYPVIFYAHPLRYLWAFKYDNKLAGVRIHADQAAVNVNFWITPDEANLDPSSGGLVIWDQAAPLDWNFSEYNNMTSEMNIRKFLARTGAKPTVVPYRSNRAVIFDSNLFHETDKIAFQKGYLNRRISLTLLYGRRGQDEP